MEAVFLIAMENFEVTQIQPASALQKNNFIYRGIFCPASAH